MEYRRKPSEQSGSLFFSGRRYNAENIGSTRRGGGCCFYVQDALSRRGI